MSKFGTVTDWQQKMGLPCGTELFEAERYKERRMRLIAEECAETLTALTGRRVTIQIGAWSISKWDPPNPVEFLDGLCDLTWVALGSAAETGWDFDAAFEEVARSNFSKTPGNIDGDKLQKGPSFTPPNLKPFVARTCCDWHNAKDQGLLDKAKFFAICEPGKP